MKNNESMDHGEVLVIILIFLLIFVAYKIWPTFHLCIYITMAGVELLKLD